MENNYLKWAVLRVVLLRSEVGLEAWEEPDSTTSAPPLLLGLSFFVLGPRGAWLCVGTSNPSSSSITSDLGTTDCHWVPQLGQTLSPYNSIKLADLWSAGHLVHSKYERHHDYTLLLEDNFFRQYLWIWTVHDSFWHNTACQIHTQVRN